MHARSALLFLALLAGVVSAQEHPYTVLQRAMAEAKAGRHAEAAKAFEQVTQMLPRSAETRVHLARALAQAGKPAAALDQLAVAVGFGVRFDASDAAWSALARDARFVRLASRMRARTAPLLRSTVAYQLDKELVPENVTWDPVSGSFFVGSMYQAKILRIAADGTITDFVPARRDGLLSVLGMKIDAARRELWAAAGNFGERPPMKVEDPASSGRGGLFRFNIDTGALVQTYWSPGTAEKPLQFNDLVIAPGGDVYATAGPAGIWRLRRDARAVEEFMAPDGAFFNGIAITADGGTLFAASHFDGVMKIDIATKNVELLELPPGATLEGIDGLYVHENSLVGIQNGTDPIRVVRAWLNPEQSRVTRLAVLEQEHPETDIPLTGVIVGDDLYYIGRSQLRAFDGKTIWPAARLKESTILKLPLEVVAAPDPDLVAERETLLAMHRDGIRAHIERDVAAIVAGHGDDFVSAYQGKIERMTREDARGFFSGYFKGATYPQYEDTDPPIVRISDDASMAWILSRTRVRRVQDGKERSFVYAGMMTYEKRSGRRIRTGNASTFE